jgi:predicted transcriptional regulator
VNPSRSSICMDARLDPTTRGKVDDLAQQFHQPRAAVLCHIMQWGLSLCQTGRLDQGESEGPVRHLYLYVEAELHGRVEKAAIAVGVKIAPWLHHMVRQITISEFPASWQEERSEERSHDSGTYGTRFMLRLDEPTQTKLQQLVQQFGSSKAKIIRHLIAQAEPEDFPPSWHMRAAERRAQHVLQKGTGNDQESMP